MGGRRRDPVERRHLPLPGRTAGHRLEAADPATFLDLTPIAALAGARVAAWRRGMDVDGRRPAIAVAALG
jgi:hypothetical protein